MLGTTDSLAVSNIFLLGFAPERVWIRFDLSPHGAELRSLEPKHLFLLFDFRLYLSQIHAIFAGFFSENLQISTIRVVLPGPFFGSLSRKRFLQNLRDIL